MSQYARYQFGPSLSPWVKRIVIANCVIFLLQYATKLFFHYPVLETFLALNPYEIRQGFLWQLVTYSFLHGDIFHLLFNMLSIWMFGSELEHRFGTSKFLQLYFFSAITGALAVFAMSFTNIPQGVVIGASGAAYGLLIAYGMTWPNREVLFWGIFPLKTKYLVMIVMALLFFSERGGISHSCHFGGLVGGFLFLRFGEKIIPSFQWNFSLSHWLKKRKFKKYQEDMMSEVKAKEKVEELLDKISKQGMGSLTKKEKSFLKDASNKYYGS